MMRRCHDSIMHAFVGIHDAETFGGWDALRDLRVASTSSGILTSAYESGVWTTLATYTHT